MNKAVNDILIIGAGIVGTAAALALASGGFRVCVVDTKRYQTPPISEEYALRVSAITPASVKFLQQLQVWQAITARRVSPFRQVEIWQEQGHSHLHFDAKEVHATVLGYIIENDVIQAALMQHMLSHEKITYLAPAQLKSFQLENEHISIALQDEQTLTAKLLIGADGAQSSLRELAGISYVEKDYHQHAIVATIHTELPHGETAYQRFLSSGPVALLPLADAHLCSLVWSRDDPQAKALLEMPDVEFNTALQDAFGSCLGEVNIKSSRLSFPLYKRHVNSYVEKRLAFIGDAAHTTHPLAGQGLNLGLQDALTLSQIITQAHYERRDIGLLYTLRRYERARKGANLLMLNTADAFHTLFRDQALPFSKLRGIGLKLTERCRPLKKILLRQAMGLSEEYL